MTRRFLWKSAEDAGHKVVMWWMLLDQQDCITEPKCSKVSQNNEIYKDTGLQLGFTYIRYLRFEF